MDNAGAAAVPRPSFARTVLHPVAVVDRDTSITIGGAGLGLVSYTTNHDDGTADLKVTHLSNRMGVPFHRPR